MKGDITKSLVSRANRYNVIKLVCIFMASNVYYQHVRTVHAYSYRLYSCTCIYLIQRQGISLKQYSWDCEITSLRIIRLDIGNGRFRNIQNVYSYNGPVLRTYDVKFITEQDGYGAIFAKFNGQQVTCTGFDGLRFKTCIIPRRLRPWSGRFTVEVFGKRFAPSAGFSMYGKPGEFIVF